MATTAIQGRSLLLGRQIGEEFRAFAYSQACDLEESLSTIEVASAVSGVDREYVAGKTLWRVTCSCLLASDENDLEELYRAGMPILVSMRTTSARTSYTGYARIASLQVMGRISSMATYTISLEGTGALLVESMESCYGSGIWQNALPWLNDDIWNNTI